VGSHSTICPFMSGFSASCFLGFVHVVAWVSVSLLFQAQPHCFGGVYAHKTSEHASKDSWSFPISSFCLTSQGWVSLGETQASREAKGIGDMAQVVEHCLSS
jgi:hypothetical protein